MRYVRFGLMFWSFWWVFSCGEKRIGGLLGGFRVVEVIWL